MNRKKYKERKNGMNKLKKHTAAKLFGAFALLNLFLFVIYYIAASILQNTDMTIVSAFLNEFATSLMALLFAVIAAQIYAEISPKSAMLTLLAMAASRFIYHIPEGYLTYVAGGYHSGEALFISIAVSIVTVLAAYLEAMLIMLLFLFVMKKASHSEKLCSASLKAALYTEKKNMFDLSKPASLAGFAAALPRFIYLFVLEIISTVDFLSRFSGTYRPSEIIYMTSRYLWVLAILLGTHALAFLAKDAFKSHCIEKT